MLGGLSVVVFMAVMMWPFYTPVFFVDQWTFLQDLIANHGRYSMALLWKQHNEHRMLFPKLFYLTDLYLFHGTNVFLLLSIFCLQLAHLTWLGVVYYRVGQLSGGAWRTAIGITAVCLFGYAQWENFLHGFQVQMILAFFAETVSITSLGMYHLSQDEFGRRNTKLLLLSWAAAIIATLSLTNGLLLWPVLLVLGLIWGFGRRIIVATAFLGAAVIALWRIGYSAPELEHTIPPVMGLARFVLLLHAGSWSFLGLRYGTVLAALAIPATVCALLWVLWKRRGDVFAVSLLTLCAFLLASSFMTAVGRLKYGEEYGLSQSRYQSGALLFWCCLSILLVRLAATARLSRVWAAVRAGCSLRRTLLGQPPHRSGNYLYAQSYRDDETGRGGLGGWCRRLRMDPLAHYSPVYG